MLESNGILNTDFFIYMEAVAVTVAAFVAIWGITSHREMTRKSHTIDLLLHDTEEEHYKAGVNFLRSICDNKKELLAYARAKSTDEYKEHEENKYQNSLLIDNLLNFLEDIAIGVDEDIFDYSLIKRAQRSFFIDIFDKAYPYIKEVRKDHPKGYIELEVLINKLKNDC